MTFIILGDSKSFRCSRERSSCFIDGESNFYHKDGKRS